MRNRYNTKVNKHPGYYNDIFEVYKGEKNYEDINLGVNYKLYNIVLIDENVDDKMREGYSHRYKNFNVFVVSSVPEFIEFRKFNPKIDLLLIDNYCQGKHTSELADEKVIVDDFLNKTEKDIN